MSLKEKCGICAVKDIERASFYCALGLHALQHRGQEGAGIVSAGDNKFSSCYIDGQINGNFKQFEDLPGNSAIGHVRYSTSGEKCDSSLKQPIWANINLGNISLAHNGNLTNACSLRAELMQAGCVFQSDVDTEILMHLIASSTESNIIDRVITSLKKVKGAYSLVIMVNNIIIGVRDPLGIRPLALGKLNGSYILASESCAFDIMEGEFIRDIQAGEMLIINENHDINSIYPFTVAERRSCVFEYIYFARPDSIIDGLSVYEARKAIGKELAKENDQDDADIVIPVPDSGVAASIGYSVESCIPFEFGIIRNHYVGRTFIEPTDFMRKFSIKLKHNANKSVLKGKRVILIDDSIVRGNTSRKIVALMREVGAKEIHMRISSPSIKNPCFYGIDTPSRDKLIAAHNSILDMEKLIGVDSLRFISMQGVYNAVGGGKYCDACFTGNYPIKV